MGTDELHKTVKPLLEQYNAHYLSGHDHCLAHSHDEGVEYVVSGMTDECCYDAPFKDIKKVKHLDFYVSKKQNPTHARAGFVSIKSQILDEADSLGVQYHDQDGAVLFTKQLSPSVYGTSAKKLQNK